MSTASYVALLCLWGGCGHDVFPSCPTNSPKRSSPVRILYAFPFRDEFDILAVLLSELADVVDMFILAESNSTLSGSPKPYYLDSEMARFRPHVAKMHRIRTELPATCNNTLSWWCMEMLRGAIADASVNLLEIKHRLRGDDILVMADVDEIVSAEVVQRLRYCQIRTPIFFSLERYIYTLTWRVPQNQRGAGGACRGSHIVGVTARDMLITAATFGSAGAVRKRRWREEGPGRNGTCLSERGRGTAKVAPVGWHLRLQGGWRQVQRSLLSFGGELGRYAPRSGLLTLLREGQLPAQLSWGPVAVRHAWPRDTGRDALARAAGQSDQRWATLPLPRGLVPGWGSGVELPFARCWLDPWAALCAEFGGPPVRRATVAENCTQVRPIGVAQVARRRSNELNKPVVLLSDEECWAEVLLPGPLSLSVGDWPKQEVCCLFGGLPECWRPDRGRTYAACCATRPGQGCVSWSESEEARCWEMHMEPDRLADIIEYTYIMEPVGEYSHARLLSRVMLAIAIGSGWAAGRPDHGSGGAFPGLEIVEVGVQAGRFAEAFLEGAELLQLPVRRYTLVDRWSVPPSGIAGGSLYDVTEDGACTTDTDHAQRLALAVERLALRWPDKVRFLQANSTSVARWLHRDGEQAHFIFIDARHDYDSVWEDLISWWPVLLPGGLFAGHDYEMDRSDVAGVKRAVDEFAWALGLIDYLVGPMRQSWMLPKVGDVPPPERPEWLRLH